MMWILQLIKNSLHTYRFLKMSILFFLFYVIIRMNTLNQIKGEEKLNYEFKFRKGNSTNKRII